MLSKALMDYSTLFLAKKSLHLHHLPYLSPNDYVSKSSNPLTNDGDLALQRLC